MKEREYAYLKMRFPGIIKVARILLSEPVFWMYGSALIIDAAMTQPDIVLPDTTFTSIIAFILGFIGAAWLVKTSLKFLIQMIGMILYKLFYPKTWRANPLSHDMRGYYDIRRNFF